jgi:N4-gp56 family major capsid protein
MANLTTTTQVDPAVAVFYDRVLLKAAHPKLVHLRFAQHARLDKKSGNTYKWRRYANLADADVPLAEGVNPPGSRLSKTDLTAQVAWYGDFVHITDVVDMTVEDPVLTIAADKLGRQAGKTLDSLMRDILAACASVSNAAGGANALTPTELTRADVDGVVMELLGGDAEMMIPTIKGSTKVGTSPVRESFWAIAHTDLIDDMEVVNGFQAVANYPTGDGVDGEWGAVGNTRWLVTTNARVIANDDLAAANDVYYIPVIGKDAYGDVELANMRNIVKAFGSGGTSDPLNRQATSGWKTVWTARILNDNFMHVLRATHS